MRCEGLAGGWPPWDSGKVNRGGIVRVADRAGLVLRESLGKLELRRSADLVSILRRLGTLGRLAFKPPMAARPVDGK